MNTEEVKHRLNHFVLREDGKICWIEKMPEEPTTIIIKTTRVIGGKTINHTLRQNYRKALQSAIANAVEVSNQDEVFYHLRASQRANCSSH
jgi:hypothetical protein